MTQPQDILTDDARELALRERLARQQFYLCFTERVKRDGDAMADLKPRMSDHLAWIAGLEQKGIAFAAGPFRDKNDASYWNGDGMFILRAESREEAAAIADTCPFHSSGMRQYRIVPWWMNEGCIQLTVRLTERKIELG
ncbi:YciI family protein [Paraburkholderia sediminicola]|uniref:YciI family protein n=1 Tax=Paraburkholderia sediminicola TaxID=458836 RepID=UPI0038BAD605